jgi:ABC-type uncharacterized transport system substrate-binding protein
MWREGRLIEWKWGDDQFDTLSGLAADLVRSNVDVIVTGGTSATKALKTATRTIPIVMAIVGDPVAAGLVDSLARPGGNATAAALGPSAHQNIERCSNFASRLANGRNVYPVLRCRSRPSDHFDLPRSLPRNPN